MIEAHGIILGRVKINKQATNFQLLFKFSPKGFSNLKKSIVFFFFQGQDNVLLSSRKVFWEGILKSDMQISQGD